MAVKLLLFYIVLLLGGLVGWVLNIIAIVHADHISGMLVARIIGVFVAPLGAVLGYC